MFKARLPSFEVSRGAWIILVLFLLVGVAVLDDYGVTWDEGAQRQQVEENLDYILGNRNALEERIHAFYGVAFDLPLLLVERVLGVEDSRSSYLSRHLLTHLFFLIGGLFCYLLAYRLFNNRLLALFAMLLFLLHPRLYAHSFFNTKDIPFLSMFMIALFLIHRAFDRNTLKAFLWCGISVAILINLRVMGLMLFAAVIAMRVLDWWYATSREERKHILKTGAVFTLTTVSVLYAVWPYLWEDPFGRFMEAITTAAHHPHKSYELFKGKVFFNTELPWDYVSTWFLITTPLVALLLGSVGILATGYRGAIRLGDIFRNTALRFEWLLLACFVLPIVAVIVLNPTLYNGWRHLYFLYAPFCLLAALGLYRLSILLKTKSLRIGVCALAGVGLVATIVEMAHIHPYQNAYFNALVDRNTPEYLRTQYEMDIWRASYREGLEYLLENYPSFLYLYNPPDYHQLLDQNKAILPQNKRKRILLNDPNNDFYFYINIYIDDNLSKRFPTIYTRKIYNNTILEIATRPKPLSWVVDKTTLDQHRNRYAEIVTREPIIRSNFDVYRNNNVLVYIKEKCPPSTQPRFFLHIFPLNVAELPDNRSKHGFDNMDFFFDSEGVKLDDKCMAIISLPEYTIDYIRTGQFNDQGELWSAIWRPQSLISKPD